ncbi:protein-disulfide isomerase [Candidatus Peregrinibacteria bacterium CG_4_10_14_0_2_um_filter_38_24]|nr:MAG: protein-disulfide isomerase [Candidatus Peregrinibacteria bacterium CG_4_10_14_0_2_um_filter_38_24]PJC38779.1 MAG: protein-disulfide isomerase [Candidatus Peregrinibacteria bacterium CG_4_9_14_0_2_um_filter_38_9]
MTETAKKIYLYGGLLGGIALVIGILIGVTAPKLTVLTTELSSVDHTRGDKESNIILIEYSDFQCPACKQYSEVVKEVVSEFESHMVFAYRYFPLRQIHKNAVPSAQAAEAAGLQGKFWEMHDTLFANQEAWSPMPQAQATEAFKAYAKAIGLDADKFEKDLNSNAVITKVNADEMSAKTAKLNHTPTFFLNGKEINNPKNLEEFRKLIRDEVEKNNK